MGSMGLQHGLEGTKLCPKRKFRFLFMVPDVSACGSGCLPPSKAARPTLRFKEMEAKHLSEDVFYAAKPDWQPVQLTLYDLKSSGEHPVFKWIKEMYKPQEGKLLSPTSGQFIKQIDVQMLDGCGNIIEKWVYEDAWVQSASFSDLDMGSNDICLCDVTIRYARAYITQ